MCGDFSDSCPDVQGDEMDGLRPEQDEQDIPENLSTKSDSKFENQDIKTDDHDQLVSLKPVLDTDDDINVVSHPVASTSDAADNLSSSSDNLEKNTTEYVSPHSIKHIVSDSGSEDRKTSTPDLLQPNTSSVDGERVTSPTLSSTTPSPPLASIALANSARASLMMHAKPMLQHSFTQTLMALNSNAINRPSFFPLMDRWVFNKNWKTLNA